ncbi:hypothetical protein CANMA_003036 [Candida margitis]|uniref:uncharacterized protein n=1 Tax=Candida margitis TaxID=1775924 RepID=UPI002225B821|nr:uncharacterized protein CANMA_003036 [Candida margitis]KAI5967490.1 hypothetical protein CANMA_003036 [Candida margitis]
MAHNQDNRQTRKRRKPYRSSRPTSNSHTAPPAPPSSASSSYPTPQTHPLELGLSNEPIIDNTTKSSVDDTKVIHFLSKLKPRGFQTVSDDPSHITIIVSSFERSLVDISTVKQVLTEKFQIDDVVTTEGLPGTIDVLVTVYGRMLNIAKAVVFLIFQLNTKVNNLQKDVFTLKSSTYKAHLLLKNGEEVQGIKYVDIAHLFSYEFNKGAYDVFVQGDLTSIFNFILHCLDRKWNLETSLIRLEPMFGIHLDQALKSTSRENIDIKNRARNTLLQYLYPASRYENIQS